MVTTKDDRAKAGQGDRVAARNELLVQLYYDRADAAQFDASAARVIDVAIAMLTNVAASALGREPVALREGDRRLH